MVQTWIGTVAEIREKDPFGRPFYESPAYLIQWRDRELDEEDQFYWRKENEIISLDDTGYNRRPRRAVVELYSTAAQPKAETGRKRKSTDEPPSAHDGREGRINQKRGKRAARAGTACTSSVSESIDGDAIDGSFADSIASAVDSSVASRDPAGPPIAGKGKARNNVPPKDSAAGIDSKGRAGSATPKRLPTVGSKRPRLPVIDDDDDEEDEEEEQSSATSPGGTGMGPPQTIPEHVHRDSTLSNRVASSTLGRLRDRVTKLSNATDCPLQVEAMTLGLKHLIDSASHTPNDAHSTRRPFACIAYMLQAATCPCTSVVVRGPSSAGIAACMHGRLAALHHSLIAQLLVIDVLQAWGVVLRQGHVQGRRSATAAPVGMPDVATAMRGYVRYRLRGHWLPSVYPLLHPWEVALLPMDVLKGAGHGDEGVYTSELASVAGTAPAPYTQQSLERAQLQVVASGQGGDARHGSSLTEQLDAILCTSQDVQSSTAVLAVNETDVASSSSSSSVAVSILGALTSALPDFKTSGFLGARAKGQPNAAAVPEVDDDIEESQQSWMDVREPIASLPSKAGEHQAGWDDAEIDDTRALELGPVGQPTSVPGNSLKSSEQRAVDKEVTTAARRLGAALSRASAADVGVRGTGKGKVGTARVEGVNTRRLSGGAANANTGQRSMLSYKLKPME